MRCTAGGSLDAGSCPIPTPTTTPTRTSTRTLTLTRTPTATVTITASPTTTITAIPSETLVPTVTGTASSTETPTGTATHTSNVTPTPTCTVPATTTQTPTPIETASATAYPSATQSPSPTTPPTATATPALPKFIEQGGPVVFESENYRSAFRGTGSAANTFWQFTTAHAGYAGNGAVQALPNTGVNTGLSTIGPRMSSTLQSTTPGTYYVYLRIRGPADSPLGSAGSSTDNTIHVGLNGIPVTTGCCSGDLVPVAGGG